MSADLDQWRQLATLIEAGPGESKHDFVHGVCSLARDIYGPRYSEIAGLFELACSGDLPALGAAVALVEREMPGRVAEMIERAIGRAAALRIDHGESWSKWLPLALLAAFARAQIGELEATDAP